jgi:hypothetical protein
MGQRNEINKHIIVSELRAGLGGRAVAGLIGLRCQSFAESRLSLSSVPNHRRSRDPTVPVQKYPAGPVPIRTFLSLAISASA